MAIFKFGFIIRKRREELGLSQEDLADGICSVPTLSRIENGERMPTQNHLEMLLQRLGYSDTILDSFVDESDYYIHELKFQIRQAYISKEYDNAKRMLEEYKQKIKFPNNINKQFLVLYTVLLLGEKYTINEKLNILEEALRLTYPKYRGDSIPHVLSYEEIILLNDIAICHALNGNRHTSIDILYALKKYYENRIINTEEALRTQPLVLYNLSKNLGLEGRYDECIEICNIGIRIAKNTSRCTYMAWTLFNLSWALWKRNLPEDINVSIKTAKQALHMAEIMGNSDDVHFFRNFIRENFSEDLLL